MILQQTRESKSGEMFRIGGFLGRIAGNLIHCDEALPYALGYVCENEGDGECSFSVRSFIGEGCPCLPDLDAVVEHFAAQCEQIAMERAE